MTQSNPVNENWKKKYIDASMTSETVKDGVPVISLNSALFLTEILLTTREKQIKGEFENKVIGLLADSESMATAKEIRHEIKSLIETL